jgi:hypothetical protein
VIAHNETVLPCSAPHVFPLTSIRLHSTIFVQVEEVRCDLTKTGAKPNVRPFVGSRST